MVSGDRAKEDQILLVKNFVRKQDIILLYTEGYCIQRIFYSPELPSEVKVTDHYLLLWSRI